MDGDAERATQRGDILVEQAVARRVLELGAHRLDAASARSTGGVRSAVILNIARPSGVAAEPRRQRAGGRSRPLPMPAGSSRSARWTSVAVLTSAPALFATSAMLAPALELLDEIFRLAGERLVDLFGAPLLLDLGLRLLEGEVVAPDRPWRSQTRRSRRPWCSAPPRPARRRKRRRRAAVRARPAD